MIYGRGTGTVTSTGGPARQTAVAGFYVNDLVYDHDNNPGTQRQLLLLLEGNIRSRYMTSTFQDINEFGLYKSTNGGTSFTKITSVNSGAGINFLDEVNDIDIQAVIIDFGYQQTETFTEIHMVVSFIQMMGQISTMLLQFSSILL